MIYEFMTICFFGGIFVETALGSCYEVTTVENFNLTRFFGIWYEALRQDKVLGSKCDRYEYFNDTTDQGCAFNIKRHAFTSQGVPFFDDLYGGWYDKYDPARFSVRNFYTNPTSTSTDFMILGTDYETFAIVYECYHRTQYEVPVKWGWLKLLTRMKHPQEFTIDKGIKVIEENGIDSSKMWATDRRWCRRWENDRPQNRTAKLIRMTRETLESVRFQDARNVRDRNHPNSSKNMNKKNHNDEN